MLFLEFQNVTSSPMYLGGKLIFKNRIFYFNIYKNTRCFCRWFLVYDYTHCRARFILILSTDQNAIIWSADTGNAKKNRANMSPSHCQTFTFVCVAHLLAFNYTHNIALCSAIQQTILQVATHFPQVPPPLKQKQNVALQSAHKKCSQV